MTNPNTDFYPWSWATEELKRMEQRKIDSMAGFVVGAYRGMGGIRVIPIDSVPDDVVIVSPKLAERIKEASALMEDH